MRRTNVRLHLRKTKRKIAVVRKHGRRIKGKNYGVIYGNNFIIPDMQNKYPLIKKSSDVIELRPQDIQRIPPIPEVRREDFFDRKEAERLGREAMREYLRGRMNETLVFTRDRFGRPQKARVSRRDVGRMVSSEDKKVLEGLGFGGFF